MPVFINSIFARVSNTIEFSQTLSTVCLIELQIQSCVSLYCQYICKNIKYNRDVQVFINIIFASFKYDRVLSVFIDSIFARISNMIELSQTLSAVFFIQLQIQYNCAGLYQQYISKSLHYDRFFSVFINNISARISNTIESCRTLLTVHFQEFTVRWSGACFYQQKICESFK